jgi:hypothetical protein
MDHFEYRECDSPNRARREQHVLSATTQTCTYYVFDSPMPQNNGVYGSHQVIKCLPNCI